MSDSIKELPVIDSEIYKSGAKAHDLWEISFVENFKYGRNVKQVLYLSGQIVLRNLLTNSFRKEFLNINLIYDRVIGSIWDKDGKIVQSNSKRDIEKIAFRIDKLDLDKVSKSLYHYKEFDLTKEEIPNFKKDFLLPNRLFDELHYAPVHLLKSDRKVNDIDFFILPSYEVLRYFFLKSSELNKSLFKKFLLSGKALNNNNNELYIKAESNENGVKRYFLKTKQGLDDSEYCVIYRMAYIENAYKCVEEVRKSLLKSGQRGIEYEYKTLKTILPQDESFEVYCSGKRFQFKGKKYFIINEIHQTREHIPIKDVELIYFSNRSRNPKKSGESNVSNGNGGKKRAVKKTTPTSDAKFTSEELGNDSLPAEIEINNASISFFEDCEKINFIEPDKISSGDSYNGTTTHNIPADILSLLDGIDKNSKNGRANTNSKTTSESGIIKERREVFYKAMNTLKSENKVVTFFQVHSDKQPSFSESNTLVESHIDEPLYSTVICQVKIRKNSEFLYIYVVKSDYLDNEISRYAIFNNWLFKSYDLRKLKQMYDEEFSKKGIKFELKNNNYNLKNSLEYHNQSDYDDKKLAEKIKKEIDCKIKN